MGIAAGVANAFSLIKLILFITILLTWFPNIKWYNEPFKTMKIFSEFFFAPFRKIIPPVGMIDLSPIVAFICLSLIEKIVLTILIKFGI